MPRISAQKPGTDVLRAYLQEQASAALSYRDVGATSESPPSGFVVDHTRVQLGTGEAVYQRAIASLQTWEHFRLGWVEAWPSETPLAVGADVAVMGKACGLWWLNACRVVYVVNEKGRLSQFGFAYGTLSDHFECGEERFLVEWDQASDTVAYDIRAFSRPNHVLTRLGYPLVRRLQRRFGRDSAAAMVRAVSAAPESRGEGG